MSLNCLTLVIKHVVDLFLPDYSRPIMLCLVIVESLSLKCFEILILVSVVFVVLSDVNTCISLNENVHS